MMESAPGAFFSNQSSQLCVLWVLYLRRSSRDLLQPESCTQRGAPPVGRQGDLRCVHGLWVVCGQQQGTGGTDLLQLLWGICRDHAGTGVMDNYTENTMKTILCADYI